MIRDGFRTSKTKQALLPALGELLVMVACQEEMKGYAVDNWTAPSMTYTLITRALRDVVCSRLFYWHVARLPAEVLTHRILSCRDPRGWSMPRGRPHASWLRQVESYLKDAAWRAWRLPGRWPDGGLSE